MAIILISGGTGLIGKPLMQKLIKQGHEVRLLSRNKHSNNKSSFYWNVELGVIDENAFNGVEHIIHLAGANIADNRWSEKRKQEIIKSRTEGIKLITSVLIKKNIHLKSFTGSSAIGIYGMITSQKIFTENDSSGNDFLADVCKQWELAYNEIKNISSKTCIIRTGVVLSSSGGMLKKLLPVFKLGLGSAIGSGKQYIPWIHIDDMTDILTQSVFNENLNGTYNAVATEHTTNYFFCKYLAKVLRRPFFMPNIPPLFLKLLFGSKADILLEGSAVSNTKLVEAGFHFKYTELKQALNDLLFKK